MVGSRRMNRALFGFQNERHGPVVCSLQEVTVTLAGGKTLEPGTYINKYPVCSTHTRSISGQTAFQIRILDGIFEMGPMLGPQGLLLLANRE